MIPIRDDNPSIRTPYATMAIIGLNVAAWVLIQGLGVEPRLTASICALGLIPAELLGLVPPGEQLRAGACVLEGGRTAWHTPFTSMFLHGGWFHIIGNMWFMWIFGNNVEDSMGSFRFVVFYLLCGLAAAALQVGLNPGSPLPMVGASGAIGGVMGAYILLYPRVHVHMLIFFGFFVTTVAVPAVLMLGYWLLIQLLGAFGSAGGTGGGTAFWAHVGGFVAGGALVFVFRDRELLAGHPYHGWSRRAPTRSWHRVDRWR